jgi:hypothetical protein
MKLALFIVLSLHLVAGAETLHYSVNWASGLSLGEASIRSDKLNAEAEGGVAGGWKFEMLLDAAVPGFTIRDEYTSDADTKLCSSQIKKTVTRGLRKSVEKIQIDPKTNTVSRQTEGSEGKSQYSVPECVHDAMSFLQFVRQELAQGRMASHQSVILGAKYDVQLTFTGTETIRVAGENVTADRVKTVIKGPKADITAELFFLHDDVRTPVLARLPLELGTFTVELLP